MNASPDRNVDLKLEVVTIPVADVDRAKRFYGNLGWRLDADIARGDNFRVVQFTPPGSSCSIHFGKGLTNAPPGSAKRLYLAVSDIETARAALKAHGAEVRGAYHLGHGGQVGGADPDRHSYATYAAFSDPDGNGWLLQEITSRLPGRIAPGSATLTSAPELAALLRRAAAAHGEHEKRLGQRDDNWPDWYAQYIVSGQSGMPLPA